MCFSADAITLLHESALKGHCVLASVPPLSTKAPISSQVYMLGSQLAREHANHLHPCAHPRYAHMQCVHHLTSSAAAWLSAAPLRSVSISFLRSLMSTCCSWMRRSCIQPDIEERTWYTQGSAYYLTCISTVQHCRRAVKFREAERTAQEPWGFACKSGAASLQINLQTQSKGLEWPGQQSHTSPCLTLTFFFSSLISLRRKSARSPGALQYMSSPRILGLTIIMITVQISRWYLPHPLCIPLVLVPRYMITHCEAPQHTVRHNNTL